MASTNFKVFNEANDQATTYTDAEYLNATQRLNGVTPGIAISRMHNKMYFQWSVMATAIAQYIVSRGYDANDYDLDGIKDALENCCGLNVRQNSTEYNVGDIKYSAALASYLFLECTVAGTTASTIPAALSTAVEGDTITDGTVTWIVRKTISLQDVKNLIGYRLPATAYAKGDLRYTESLPPLWYLECTTAGTTASGALSITTPTVGNTVTDGTAEWTIRSNAQELAGKANRQLSNLDTNNLSVHVVVDSYYNSNTGDWYRVYDDGWVEQGGYSLQGASYTLTLLKPFADTRYTVVATCDALANSRFPQVDVKTETTIKFSIGSGGSSLINNNHSTEWVAYGMGASV